MNHYLIHKLRNAAIAMDAKGDENLAALLPEAISALTAALNSIMKTISDQAAGEPVAWVYKRGNKIYLHTSQLDHFYSIDNGESYAKGAPLYAAPTTGSAPTEINAVRYLKLREHMVMTVPPLAQGPLSLTALDDVLDAAPASRAVSVLTDASVDEVMEQAQVFASAWSMVGGPFDFGEALETAEAEKVNLRALLAASMGGDKS